MNPNPEQDFVLPQSNRRRRREIHLSKKGASFIPEKWRVIYMPRPSGVAKSRRAAKARKNH